jgi:TolB-like protein
MKNIMQAVFVVAVAVMVLLHPLDAAAEFTKIKIAVLDFEQKGKYESEDIGKMVAEWLTTRLVETGRFDIVERRLLNKVLAEQSIGSSGLVDPSSASQLGRVLGVKTVVTGSVSNYGGVIDINARLISVETASIRAAESASTESPKDLRKVVALISDKIMQTFPLEGYVLDRADNKVILDLGRRQGVRPGMRFVAYVEGKTRKHPKTGEILDVETVERGILEIREVKDKTASSVIVKEFTTNGIDTKCMVRGLLKDEEERIATVNRLDEERARARAIAAPAKEEKKASVPVPLSEPSKVIALPMSIGPAIESVETDDFRYDLKQVKMSGGELTVFIEATNKSGKNRYLAVYDQTSRYVKSTLTDEMDKPVEVSEVFLWDGDKRTSSYDASRGIYVQDGKKATVEMIFKDVPAGTSLIKLLNFHPYTAVKLIVFKWRETDVQFKEIRVLR